MIVLTHLQFDSLLATAQHGNMYTTSEDFSSLPKPTKYYDAFGVHCALPTIFL